ncbi:uncharacterized protein LOC129731569 [Wyeomyia smithii]|uniref:uncharacterized protein LOC129731569 n=1 Tax=Wyeomyia smithii TaxID=174621 RepID=UPI002467C9F9|nr:uncharacterized protein LOC129731569 [Wyeomyia smithii]
MMERSSKSDSHFEELAIGHRKPESIQRWTVCLSVMALALTGLGYDPFLRGIEQQAAAEADAEAEVEGFYAGIEEEAEEEEDIEIKFQPNLYLARIFAPSLMGCLLSGSRISLRLVCQICALGHVAVISCYFLLAAIDEIDGGLAICGFAAEFFWASKMLLYYYQVTIYSSDGERFSNIIYGVIAQCTGSAVLPLILNELEEYWENTQYFINLIVTLIQMLLLLPSKLYENTLQENSVNTIETYKFPRLVTLTASGVIILMVISNVTLQWFLNNNETLLRPFLAFLAGDDSMEAFWNVTYNGIAFTLLGFYCTFLSANQVMIAALVTTFTAGVGYLYFEEKIAARLALPMTAFTFGTALSILVDLWLPNHRLAARLGVIFTGVNLASYAYFGLLTLLWSSPDITIIVVWAANGFFCLGLLVLCRELTLRMDSAASTAAPESAVRSASGGSFQTVITTIA